MIYSITQSQLQETSGMCCLENDFVLCDHLSNVPHINAAFQSEMLIMFFCLNGHLQMTVDDKIQHLGNGDAILCKPLQTIHQVLSSSDCQAFVLFYTPRIADHLLPTRLNLSQVLEGDFTPIVHFGDQTPSGLISILLDLLRRHATNPLLPFRSNSLFHLFSTLFFEVLNNSCSHATTKESENSCQTSNRASSLFNQFIKKLNEDGGRHRTVSYYADLLCVSPKHLSKIIKEKTSNRALDVINTFAIQQIKIDLMLTDLPIIAIADKYNFANHSFFCQYVKQHLGMSPQKYRSK